MTNVQQGRNVADRKYGHKVRCERGADISLRSYLNRSLEILYKRMIWLSWMFTFKRSNYVSVMQPLYR